jgi:DNA-binding transcriptional regulator YiaG
MHPDELKRVRIAARMSQTAFAGELRVPRTSLARYESGARDIPAYIARMVRLIDHCERAGFPWRDGGPNENHG